MPEIDRAIIALFRLSQAICDWENSLSFSAVQSAQARGLTPRWNGKHYT